MLFLEAKHGLTGVAASASLVDRVEECQAEFQPKGESRRKEAMSCQSALAFRAVAGENKVRVYKTLLVVLRVPMADGSQRTVKVNQGTLNAYMTPLGSSLPVVYNPGNPDDVRLPMTFERAQHYLELVGLGLMLLMVAFIGPILRAARGVSYGKETSVADEAAPALTPGQLALLRVREAQLKHAGAAPQLRSTRRGDTRMAAAGGLRR
jgi:hypothetical protein